ncbi:hypothetical protein ACIPC2_14260 [Curtobacterium pusillum]|uniref:hypothetical protein n=1 Tax=Curtobacterium pusillum TaxID=69373 RepID=UPI0038128853
MKHTSASLNQKLDYSHKLWSTFDLWQDSEDISNKNLFLSALILALGEQDLKHIDVQPSLTGDGAISVRLFTETAAIVAEANKTNPIPNVVIVARKSLKQIQLVRFPYVAADNEGDAGDLLIDLHYRDIGALQLGNNFQRWDNYKALREFQASLVSDLS